MEAYNVFDEFMLKRGAADNSIDLNSSVYMWMYLVQGIIVGAPVYFIDEAQHTKAVICRLSHININAEKKHLIRQHLSGSLKTWRGIPLDANLLLDNPTLIMVGSTSESEEDRQLTFRVSQICLDQYYSGHSPGIFTYPQLMHENYAEYLAVGITLKPSGDVVSVAHPSVMMPGAICKAYSIDVSYCLKDDPAISAVEQAYLNLISWLRKGRLENNIIMKFAAYWLALEASQPPNIWRRRDIRNNTGILFGFFSTNHRSIMDSREIGIVDSLGQNYNEFMDIFSQVYSLRVRIFHLGATESTTHSGVSQEYALACYLLKDNILNKCLMVLRDAIQNGLQQLEQVWPTYAVHYVLSNRYNRQVFFNRSFFEVISRDSITVKRINQLYV